MLPTCDRNIPVTGGGKNCKQIQSEPKVGKQYIVYSQTCLIRSWRDHQKNQIFQEFELGKLCSKYKIVKRPIKNVELFTNSNYTSSN